MNELFHQIALTQVKGVGAIMARHLIAHVGSASAVFAESRKALLAIDGVGPILVKEIESSEPKLRAEKEVAFVEKNKIHTYFIGNPDYPYRLRECSDAPILLYAKGDGVPESKRVVSVVGTRNITPYGKECAENLLSTLSQQCDDLLVVSGLAYGIDITAHRSALAHRIPTFGVLAHGLDRIYPSEHRKTAIDMLEAGGLITEFPSGTRPDKSNFVMRNRIVAGLADVVVVVESAEKGGSLITAGIANSYNREVCAFPGRASDHHSLGCNRLILKNRAAMIQNATDLIELMNWDLIPKKESPNGVQRTLFVELTTDEESVMASLREHESLLIDELAYRTAFPIYILSSLLLDLEFKGVVKAMPGGSYKAIG